MGDSDSCGADASSFLMEMTDVAGIAAMAEAGDLVLLDELGKATSTQDGAALAWATAEYLSRLWFKGHELHGCLRGLVMGRVFFGFGV